MGQWRVRDGNEKDIGEILSLRELVFGEEEKDKLDPQFWKWEFENGPDGKALVYIVNHENRIIGHFADLPRRFSLHGDAVCGTLSVDLMVHPDHRRKGIFAAMGKYGAQRVKQENGLFRSAFPIRLETIRGFKKMGWEEVAKLPVLVYPIRFRGIFNRYLRFFPLSLLLGGFVRFLYFLLFGLSWEKKGEKIEIERVDSFDERFDRFWETARSFYPMIGVRNRQYLTWRYLQNPTRHYTVYRAQKRGEIIGYIVLRKVELLNFNSAVIVDLLAPDEEVISALVRRGIQHSRQEGADLLGFMVPRKHSYYRLLRKMGFLPSFKTFLFMIHPQQEKKDLIDPSAWYLNWGDTDVL